MIYKYKESKIRGVYEIQPDIFRDNRGSITKTFDKKSFDELGISCKWEESLITENDKKGIIRGFHFQNPPFCQAKTIFCVTGAIRNWVLDIRVNSPTYGQVDVFELDSKKKNFLYIPEGTANCYLILEDKTIISYNLTSHYEPDAAVGINWKSVGIEVDYKNIIYSAKDEGLPPMYEFKSPFNFKDTIDNKHGVK